MSPNEAPANEVTGTVQLKGDKVFVHGLQNNLVQFLTRRLGALIT